MKLFRLILSFSLWLTYLTGYSQTHFADFEAFIQYASEKNVSLKKGEIEISQAKKSKLAAILGVLDPNGNTSLSYKNNVQLPVTLVPSQLLGGKAGEYERVQFGLQYETQFNFNAELKLLNLAGWQGLRLAKTNIALAENQKKISQKQFYENAAALYFNILTIQAQKRTAQQHLLLADTIRQNVQLLYQKGLANEQDRNEAQVSYLKIVQSVEQADYLIQQQYIALKILCDLPETALFLIEENAKPQNESILAQNNEVITSVAQLRQQMTLENFKKSQAEFLPSISLFYASSQQQFSNNARLFDNAVNWIPSSYVGLRLSIPLPSANTISQRFKTQYDYLLAQEDYKQAKIKANNQVNQLNIDYQKALNKAKSTQVIVQIKKEIYLKNLMNFQAGIINLNRLLESFQAMLDAEYEFLASQVAVQLAVQKINIHNNIK